MSSIYYNIPEVKRKREAEYYLTDKGKVPFQEWLDAIKNAEVHGIVLQRIDRAEDGNFGDWKPLKGGIYDMRIHLSPGYRIYFALEGRRLIILLLGGEKRNQKRNIGKAKEYWEDYKNR